MNRRAIYNDPAYQQHLRDGFILVDERCSEKGNLIWRLDRRSREFVLVKPFLNNRYYKINTRFDGKRYMLCFHQLVYFLHHGSFPEMIDHIDRDQTNNRISNLRAANSYINSRNHCRANGIGVGYNGVSYCSRDKLWSCEVSMNGEKVFRKCFKTELAAAIAFNEFICSNLIYEKFVYLNVFDNVEPRI